MKYSFYLRAKKGKVDLKVPQVKTSLKSFTLFGMDNL